MINPILPGSGSKYYPSRADLLFLVISVGLITLNIVRILNIPLTFDECAPHAEAVRPYIKILSFEVPSSNDHLLNSVLRKFFLDIFTDTPFWRRFDNLLAQVMFLYYSKRLAQALFPTLLLQLCLFLVLNLQPFMFEFWGLSRGYGLSLALMMASVHYITSYSDTRRLMHLNLALYLGALSVYAHIILLNYYCGLIGSIVLLYFYTSPKQRSLPVAVSVLVASGVLALLVASPIIKLQQHNQLYFGGNTNILNDTLRTVIKENMAAPDGLLVNTLTGVTAIALAMQSIYWIVKLVRQPADDVLRKGVLLWALTAIPVVSIITQHILLGTLYPLDRVALFFIPLYLLAFCYWLWQVTMNRRRIGTLSIGMITSLMTINFILNTNTNRTRIWWYGQYDVFILERVLKERDRAHGKISIGVGEIFAPSFSYYAETKYKNIDVLKFRDCPREADTISDYYYIPGDCRTSLPKMYVQDTTFFGYGFMVFRKMR